MLFLGRRESTRHTLNFCIKQQGMRAHSVRWALVLPMPTRNLQPAIVKGEKMHLYVPTLYVYVYQKFDEKGRLVERKKRELCTVGANRSSKVAPKIRSSSHYLACRKKKNNSLATKYFYKYLSHFD